ncbi:MULTISPECIES: G-D-S-L family lipolytic protein [unclassified Kaistella]|uniref:G-D-S-L family lipolytic protein n=1 Tax=unclassified Kaistella TaxID=2762626 RepID=UPI002733A182|nr:MULTISPECIES: G-D-S-L family lipolytic protein [unclassified Kaistella]MDP2452896.1 G-D-S-L family lipolytic protein [Kaistella sp. SH11-4b]MDP2455805.1 G-D-S-L family lipolytic protein [Kaistella sp. SH40-3]MDP2458709.1 G-D-S-L family lipolytic protein [Kaistella sp. SH19-2b]
MKKILISTIAVSALLATVGCKTDFDTDVSSIQVTSGDANFSKFVSIGNSLTSGYRDGALYSDGQMESYPAMMAKQMKLAGGGEFTQPMMPNNVGGFTNLFAASGGTDFYGKLTLKVVNGALSPTPSAPGANLDMIGGAGKMFNNMGVPGAKSFHLGVAGYGNANGLTTGAANPYFVRFATSPTASVIGDAVAQKPTFFSLWIGNNDVLSYATSGGAGVDRTGNPNAAVYGSNDISDPGLVATVINNYVNALTAGGAKGVIANIPNVTSIPYFTRVPAKPIPGDPATVSALNAGYATYNAGLGQAKTLGYLTDAEYNQRLIKFTVGVANGAVIVDKDLTDLSALGIPSYRQTTSKDLVLLTASSQLTAAVGGGTSVPLADKYVLTEKETARVLTATAAYNASIQSLADAKGLAFVDANKKMTELSSMSGIQFDGVKYTATFVTGGTFSLDGVHLTGRGYALIANEFMRVINLKYKSTLPMVNVNSYQGVTFP